MPTDSAAAAPSRAWSASACELYRELIGEALARGRNAEAIWKDLVDHDLSARYASGRWFVRKLRGAARVVITTAPGEDYGECGVMVRGGCVRRVPAALKGKNNSSV